MGNDPRIPRSWNGGTPLRSQSLQQLAITTGRNEALADFFQTMLDHRWEVQDDRRDARLDRREVRLRDRLSDSESSSSSSSSSGVSKPDYNLFENAIKGTIEGSMSSTGASVGTNSILEASGVASWYNTLKSNNIDVNRHAGESDTAYYARLQKVAQELRKSKQPTDEEIANPEVKVSDQAGGMIDAMKSGHINAGPFSYLFNSKISPMHYAMQGVGHLDDAISKAPGVESVQDSKGVALVNDGLLKALDVLSRPVQAVAGFEGAMTDNKNQKSVHIADRGLSGASFMAGEDPLLSNPLGVFSAAPWKTAWENLSGQESTTFSDVIRQNARQDPEQNMFDNKKYQAYAGFAGDVASDPLNFLGLGIAKGAISAGSKAAKLDHAAELKTLASDLEALKVVRSKEGDLVDSETIYNLLGGGYRKPATYKERSDLYKGVRGNVEHIQNQLMNVDVTKFSNKKIPKLDALKARLTAEREATVVENGRDTFLGDLRYRLGIDEATGKVDAGAVGSLDKTIRDIEIGRAYESERIRNWRSGISEAEGLKGKRTKVANETLSKQRYAKDVKYRQAHGDKPLTYDEWINEHKTFDESLGAAWSKDYRLSDEERQM